MKKLFAITALLISDMVMLICSFLISYWMRVWLLPELGLVATGFFPLSHFYQLTYALLMFVLVFFYERLYTETVDPYEEFLHLFRGLILAVILISVFVYFSGLIEVFARTILFMIPIWGAMFLPLGRKLTRWLLRKSGFFLRRCAVIGNEESVEFFLLKRSALEHLGFNVMGWVGRFGKFLALPHLGEASQLEKVIKQNRLDSLFILSEDMSDEELRLCVNQCEHLVGEMRIVPKAGPLQGLATEIEYLDDQLLLKNRNNLFSAWNRLVKRGCDMILAMILLLILGIPMLIIALWLRLDSTGPVFFKQLRLGRAGKTFQIWKFRTMYLDNEVRLTEFLERHPASLHEWEIFKKIKSEPDPRVTRAGNWLRRFSIDEFPQIIQVLLGEMSLVGPRPYLIREQEEISDSAAIIFRVKSGLTGLWQIRGRNELPFRERIRLDEYYVRNWSISLDLLILLKTFMVVVKGKGAY